MCLLKDFKIKDFKRRLFLALVPMRRREKSCAYCSRSLLKSFIYTEDKIKAFTKEEGSASWPLYAELCSA